MVKKFNAGVLDYSLDKVVDIAVCGQCGHGKTDTSTSGDFPEGPLHETGSYDSREKVWHRVLSSFLQLLERSKLSYLSAKGNGLRLLEIGCGKGRFLETAKNTGYTIFGLEPSKRSYGFAQTRLGDKVAPISIEDLGEDLKYDVIVMWHVLEHISDPEAVLGKAKMLLEEGGEILIAVPNFSSVQANLGKANWYHLDPVRHLHHFSPGSLKPMLKRNNLRLKCLYFNFFYDNYIGELITLTNTILPDKNVIFNILKLNPHYIHKAGWIRASIMLVLTVLSTLIVLLPALLLTFITEATGQAGTMVALVTHGEMPNLNEGGVDEDYRA
jgi:SAM-dependent methyltransferase